MIVRLCQTQLQKRGPDGQALVRGLRDRAFMPAPQACLDRCETCDKNHLLAIAHGTIVVAPSVDVALTELQRIADED